MDNSVFIILSACACIISGLQGNENVNLTEDQIEAFKLFKTFATQFENPVYLKTDLFFIRWLQAYNFDVKSTQEKFSMTYAWRQESKIDNILAEDFPSTIPDDFPFTIDSFDKFGRPVAFAPAGRYNLRKMAVKGHAETMNRFGTMCFELMEAYMYDLQCSGNWTEGVKPQFTLVVDMSAGSMWTFACYNCLVKVPEFISMYDNNYPELMYRAVMINVPKLLVVVLNSLKTFMSTATQEAIHIYGHDKQEWSDVLLELISPDQIPTQYGGTKTHIPISSRNSDRIWNWNNPVIERILLQARKPGNMSFQNEGCQVPKSFSIPNANTAINEVISDPDHITHTNLPTQHRHRHGHGLNHERNTSKPNSDTDTMDSNYATVLNITLTDDDDESKNTIIQENSENGISESDISDKSNSNEENITIQPDNYESTTEISIHSDSDDDFVFDNMLEENNITTGANPDQVRNGCTHIVNLNSSFRVFVVLTVILSKHLVLSSLLDIT